MKAPAWRAFSPPAFANVITLGLYKSKENPDILLAHYYRGAIMAANKIQTGIRFEPELLYKISCVAKENKRSLNAQLEYLAQACVKEFEAANGPIAVKDEKLYRK